MRMQYLEYGKNGPKISRLGFGCMRLPTLHNDYNAVNYPAATRILRAAMEAGVNFFDSHATYHGSNSELALGKALKGWKGPRICIQTKTPWYKDEPREYFEKLLYATLEKLGVDGIDYLFHHSLSMDVWRKRGRQFIAFTDWAMNRGLIHHRGFSSHDSGKNINQFIKTGEFDAMLVPHNWLNPVYVEQIALAAERGMGVSVMNPVGGGFLAMNAPQVLNLLPGAKTAAEVGLRYALATPGVVAALSGMNAIAQVRENVATASRKTPLTAGERQAMNSAMARIEAQTKAFCSACGYCMPCPHGVDIPLNFRALQRERFFGQTKLAKLEYQSLKTDKSDTRATRCKRCGKCEPKCPNQVPIVRQLREVAHTLETSA